MKSMAITDKMKATALLVMESKGHAFNSKEVKAAVDEEMMKLIEQVKDDDAPWFIAKNRLVDEPDPSVAGMLYNIYENCTGYWRLCYKRARYMGRKKVREYTGSVDNPSYTVIGMDFDFDPNVPDTNSNNKKYKYFYLDIEENVKKAEEYIRLLTNKEETEGKTLETELQKVLDYQIEELRKNYDKKRKPYNNIIDKWFKPGGGGFKLARDDFNKNRRKEGGLKF